MTKNKPNRPSKPKTIPDEPAMSRPDADPATDALALAEGSAVEPAQVAAAPAAPAAPPVEAAPAAEAAPPAPASTTGAVVSASTKRHRTRPAVRFLVAFLFGLLAVMAASAGALAAYESANADRVLPGVHVGTVDLSGLTPSAAAARLREAYASLSDGTLVLAAGDAERTVSFGDLGRRIDADGIVLRAMAVGRGGPTAERIASNLRMFVRGVNVLPAATFELAALRHEIDRLAIEIAVPAHDASAEVTELGFMVNPGSDGRLGGVEEALAAAQVQLTDAAAPSEIHIELPTTTFKPDVTTEEAAAARAAAEGIAVETTLIDADRSWTITAATIRGWITFAVAPDGTYGPVVAREGLEAGLAPIAADVASDPVDASFLLSGNQKIVGVSDAKEGRALDMAATVETLVEAVEQRAHGLTVPRIPISVTTIEPLFTTAEATKTAPLMKPISEWTTYFPVGIKNGGGVNIWIPARELDGMVVLPGAWFDFWKAIGPVTRENGYKDGGAIIDGHTEPQGALAGGICSCSTTMFNAALRGGLEMGARRNHYYYIDRYPLGLDATVFQSGSGSIQTMSWRNDTDAPILIRGTGWSVGSKGYVKFVLWSVPTGRTVTFSTPIVKNQSRATDTIVYTTDLAPGVRERVEYAVDGKDVWVTRTVKDASGTVIHKETYYSHYSRVTGVLRIGVAPKPTATPTPTPIASTPPAPTAPPAP
ncbi:MAG: VanW family protein [Chloroflexota bacterium]